MKTEKEILSIARLMKQTPLFFKTDDSILEREAEKAEKLCFSKGDIIASSGENSRKLGIILKGRAEVTKDSGRVKMSVLSKGDIFGAITLFGNNPGFLTDISAAEKCEAVFFSPESIERILSQDSETARCYIGYLSDRIGFLNGKIDSYTGTSSSAKLACWLLKNTQQDEEIILSMTKLCGLLNISRASVYRAFEELENAECVVKNGKNIKVTDREKLKRYSDGTL